MPDAQFEQEAVAKDAAYLPAVQDTHLSEESLPVVVLTALPAKQEVQPVEADDAEYLPAAQPVHAIAPVKE